MNGCFLLRLVLALSFCSALCAQSYTFSIGAFPAPVSANTYTPGGVAVDASGNVYATTYFAHGVIKVTPRGEVSILAGNAAGNSGYADGVGRDARFNLPRGIALDADGNLLVADMGNSAIRKVTPAGVVTTVATGTHLSGPQGIAIDPAGNLFIADTYNHAIRKVTPAGVATTIAGTVGSLGVADGTGASARFNQPQGIALDEAGNLYVADSNNHAVRKITPAGVVTTLAGLPASPGRADGTGNTARFYFPMALALDGTGNVFVADSNNSTVRKITPAGVVTTIGGSAGAVGTASGIGAAARFGTIFGLAVATSGNLYVGDRSGIILGVPSSQLAFTVDPQSQSVAAGSTTSLSVTATGVAPITYQWQKNGTPIAGATNSSLSLARTQASDAGAFTVTASNSVGTLLSARADLTVLAALANDDFANAQILSGASGSVAGRNHGATGEPTEPTHDTAAATLSSVWYEWTAPQDGTVVFDIVGNYSGFAAYSGTSLATLTRVGYRNGSTWISFRAVAGTSYHLAVGNYFSWNPVGNFTLNWRMLLNDDFANAQVITGNSGIVISNNRGATAELGEPIHVSQAVTNTSIWFRWTPTSSGTASFGTGVDNALAAYVGNSLTSLTQLAQGQLNDTTTAFVRTRVVFNVTAGTTYFIAAGSASFASGGDVTIDWTISTLPVITAQPVVRLAGSSSIVSTEFSQVASAAVPLGSGFSIEVQFVSSTPATVQWSHVVGRIAGANSGTYSVANAQADDSGFYNIGITNAAGGVSANGVRINLIVPPANDNFVAAATLTGLTGSVTGSNTNATGENGEPIHWNLAGTASSVWYKWTAPVSSLAAIDTVGSSFDTVLAVYAGPASGAATLANLTRLTQDDDRGGGRTSLVSFAATSGTTYYIAVGGSTSSARGTLRLNWQLTPVLAITAAPVNATVASGGTATFNVTATGSGLTYQWNRNGTALPGATNSTLTVVATPGSTNAVFTVTITNSSGVRLTSDPVEFNIATPPLTNFTVRNARSVAGGLLWSLASGDGVLVAVGDGGMILSSSDNGRTWLPRASGTTNWIVGVTYGAGKFVAVADKGLVLLSLDGITWTPAASSGTAQRLNSVLCADGKFVAVGEGGTIVTSADANIWTPRVSNTTNWLHGLAYNTAIGHFVTTGQGGVILFSPDAITWTKLPVTGLAADVEAVVAVDSYAQFVAIGHNGTAVGLHRDTLTLKTGETVTTWSGDATATGAATDFVGLAAGAGALFATGSGGKIYTATSDKGPWTQLTSGTAGILLAGLFVNDTLFIVGENETVLQSDPIYLSRLRNISTRGQVGTGGSIMISGFIVRGDGPKQVLVRAAGPGLATFGVTGTLAAPVLTLLDSKAATVATNTGWSTAANASAIAATAARVSAFPFAAGSSDSALIATLNPGDYTVQVSGANNTTGICIVEVYDTDAIDNGGSHAVNISTRGLVGSGAAKMIAGFIIDGAASRRVLIRAVGPGLAQFGLTGLLAEPTLELYNARGLLHATAAAWGLQPNADEIRGAFDAAGAFKLTDGSKDSAMVISLPPGNWTVQVGGASDATGVAIIEVYALP